ncbi:restriction endonuclease subunit S [Vibrio vulnificus]|nr:restriction endonuclease subunit S [Vibrio vulnificus]EIA1334838.1 restriction endonuclease subunit S [Vibrio vulnificus]EIV8607491.1 restriction endonuclease subunit S [Vibrio vulnificus]EIX4867696.1 restriction endonuclease subunit S [Vibrio vulnificus]EIZ1362700.1 restriction endonuclease subunit S [Vibrio vulnificus]
MNCNWQTMTLAEAGITLIDCDHKTPKAQESGFPYIGIPQLKDCRITLDGARLICEEDFNHWRRKAKPQEHDIIMSRRCNPGETGYVTADLNIALGQNLVLLRSDGKTVYPPFLRWLTRGPYWWNQVNTFINVGAVFESLKCADIPNFEVKVPSIEEQKKICNCLSALDDKISLNIKTNQTLEQMAQTIFKSWFVDFDPVKAKMNGEQPEGMNAATAALFPEKLVESELGLIPDGWNLSEIGDEVTVVGGGTPSKKNDDFWIDGHIHWTSPKDLSGVQDKVLLDTASKVTEAGLKKISSGLLPVDTVLLSSRAPVGYLALAKVPLAINQGYIAMKCEKQLPPEFVLQWCVHRMDEIKQRASGSTFAEISKKNFKPISVVVPSEDVLSAYQKLVKPLYDAITSNVRQSERLSNLRDTLLPKLLAGEVELTVDEESQ